MTDEAALLASLPNLAFAFVLVLGRTSVTLMLLPGLGEVELPPTIRAGLALAMTLLILPSIAPLVTVSADAGILGLRMIVAELCVGAALGWLSRLPVMALTMAGAIISYMAGLSSVVQTDPALGGQSAAIARLFGLVAPVLILTTGLYALPLSALAESYQVIPPGSFLPAGPLADAVIGAIVASFGLSLQLAAPVIFIGVVFQCALGLLARLVPQLQAYTAAAPGQILGGLLLVALVATSILGHWTDAVRSTWTELPGL